MPSDQDEQAKKWAGFVPYKGRPLKELPRWLDALLAVFFGFLALAAVFFLSGLFLLLVVYRYGGLGAGIRSSFALNEPGWAAWARFVLGGLVGVFVAVRWWRRSPVIED